MKRILSASRPRIIRLLPVLVLPLVVAACGTFPLSGNTYGPPGKTQDQHQMDILVCKDQAKLAANTTGAAVSSAVAVTVASRVDRARQVRRRLGQVFKIGSFLRNRYCYCLPALALRRPNGEHGRNQETADDPRHPHTRRRVPQR